MGASFFQILQLSCYFWKVVVNICHFPSDLLLQGFKFSSQSVKFSGQLVFIFLKCIFLKTEFNKDNLGNGNGPLYICVTVFLIHCTQTWVWPVEVFIIHNKLCLKYLNKSDNGKYGQWENGEDDKSCKSSYPPSPCAFLCKFFLVCLWYILVFFWSPNCSKSCTNVFPTYLVWSQLALQAGHCPFQFVKCLCIRFCVSFFTVVL